MSRRLTLVTALLLGTASLLALEASAGTPALDQRQQNQAQRIGQGVRSGELTRPETRRLLRGQRELRRDERAAQADGVVTGRERAGLQREANQQSRRIHRQKNDAQDRR
jgi:hypothetical protein